MPEHDRDQDLLDSIFDSVLARIEDGRSVDVAQLLGERHDLHTQVEELVRLAREIAVGESVERPVISGYTVLHELGRGGMGTVFLARQERLGGRLVALKVLPPVVSLSSQARERFKSEVTGIARLRHPNIVAVHDVVQAGGVYAYAMEWVDGISLAGLIEHLKGTERESTMADVCDVLKALPKLAERDTVPVFVCRIGIAVASALHAVHREGLLHRDVKPSNILLRHDGTPLLSDFGLAREADSVHLTQTGHFVGTLTYAAPEQLRGRAEELDHRTDVYSLGVTLYHALTLQTPFKGQSAVAILRQVESGKTAPLRKVNPKVSLDLQTIVTKAMDPDPQRRYQTANDLGDDLDRLLTLQPIHARPAGLLTRTAKLARRNRPMLAAGAAGGLLALALAAALVVYIFFMPRWVSEHMDNARLALFDPSAGDRVVSTASRAMDHSRLVPPAFAPETAEASLSQYAAALRLAPTNEQVRLERDVVALARDVSAGTLQPPVCDDRLATTAPVTCRYADEWFSTGLRPQPDTVQLAGTTATDLRCLGLLAFLCQDVLTSIEAWSQLDLVKDPDPLIEVSLGQLFLAMGEPARAYPRLKSAVREFPQVGFLLVALADAAFRCGDLQYCERLLERARGMPYLDPTHGLKRLEADLYAATGRDELARERYEWLRRDGVNFVAILHYGKFLEQCGELHEALRVYQDEVQSDRRVVAIHRAFIEAANRWWNSQALGERRTLLRSTLDEEPDAPYVFIKLLRNYSASSAFLAGFDTAQLKSGSVRLPDGHTRPERTGEPEESGVARTVESAPLLQTASLSALAERVDITNSYRGWRRYLTYPRVLKELLFTSWLMRDGADLTSLIERLYRVYRGLRLVREWGANTPRERLAAVAAVCGRTNILVPPGFTVEKLWEETIGNELWLRVARNPDYGVDGRRGISPEFAWAVGEVPRSRLEAIRNPDYGHGVVVAYIDYTTLKVLRVNDTSVELLASESGFETKDFPPEVGTVRFDITALFGGGLFISVWEDADRSNVDGAESTVLLRISPNGAVENVGRFGKASHPLRLRFDFTTGGAGYAPGAYLDDWHNSARVYRMGADFILTRLADDASAASHRVLSARGVEFDQTGRYGRYLTTTESSWYKQPVTVISQLLPDLTWVDLTAPISPAKRFYGDLAFSTGGTFDQRLYVTDIVTDSVMAVDPDGAHTEFASGFDQVGSISISDDGERMYVSDINGVYCIRPVNTGTGQAIP